MDIFDCIFNSLSKFDGNNDFSVESFIRQDIEANIESRKRYLAKIKDSIDFRKNQISESIEQSLLVVDQSTTRSLLSLDTERSSILRRLQEQKRSAECRIKD